MKKTTQRLVMLLILLLPLPSVALAAEQNPGTIYQMRFSQISVATESTSPQRPETPLDVLEQVASLFSSEEGLAINDTASIFLLCDPNALLDNLGSPTNTLSNLGVGLKIRF